MVVSGLETESRLAPRCNRAGSADGRLAFTTAVRMVVGVHDRTSYGRSDALVTGASCLTEVNILMIDVAYLTDGSHAVKGDPSHLARGKSYESVTVLLAHELSHIAGRSYELSALAVIKLNVVDECTNGDISECKCVAGLDIRIGTGSYYVAYLEAVGSDDVSLLAVLVFNECDECASVRIILESLDNSINALLVSLEVDDPVLPSVSAASVTNSYVTVIVSAGLLGQRSEEALFGSYLGKLAVIRNCHLTSGRRSRLI